MITGNFYYISDDYYEKFKNCGLMGNKAEDEEGKHGRPCFYCFRQDDLYWMVPISSQIEKYKKLYHEKMERYNGKFDGIRFGYVNAQERAFLIQNMCPVTDKYIKNEYQHLGSPVAIDYTTYKRIVSKATKVSALVHNNNSHLIFPDVLKIEEVLKSKNK